jgi:hypothetical protein
MANDRLHFLSSFHLKIIGMISMIFDHFIVIGELTGVLNKWGMSVETIRIFRIIGRISFVLFAYLIIEGITYSHNKIKYLIRLFSLAIILDLGYFIFSGEYYGNPITTLALGALSIYFLNQKKIYLKFLSLLPISLTLLIAFEIIPLKADYAIYGLCTILIFYFSNILVNFFSNLILNTYNLDRETFKKSSSYLTFKNISSCILFIVFNLIVYIFNPIWNNHGLFSENMAIQVYAIIACIFIFFYSGKRGYNKKWFQYGCYLFFPLHLILLYLFFILCTII